jgi:benzoate membrane transport protein
MKQWLSLTSAATAAVIIGFASTILVVLQAAQAVGATLEQQVGCGFMFCHGGFNCDFVLAH